MANEIYPLRRWLLIVIFVAITLVSLWRAVDLQVLNNDFLKKYGNAMALRVVTVPAHRGMISDRNGEPLAISTPVESVWAVPNKVLQQEKLIPGLARELAMEPRHLKQLLEERFAREFVYLKRHITPDQARAIKSLSIPGVYLQREYRRYYPAAEVSAHIIGFTNVDDSGQEGLELAYDDWLSGTPGSKRVLKDRLGRVVENVESIESAAPGKALALSIDKRIQYLAFRELTAAVKRNNARGGSLVLLDANSGEVMALAGQPSYNPNNRSGLKGDLYRNRAVTDVFEPGSTIKPFTIIAALKSGMYSPTTRINTAPGYFKVNNNTIRDINNYGDIDVASVIKKSSNVGASKIALSLGPEKLWDLFKDIGFGESTGSGFPGESEGLLNHYQNWSEFELATIAFGYGVSVTTLQLAQAYSIIASGGLLRPVSFIKQKGPVSGKRVISANIIEQVRIMMEAVTEQGAGGQRAAVAGYRVAGKTGTAHKAISGSYAEDRYRSLFAGFAPATDPRLVLVVVIDEPRGGEHFGGQVAAPVFSKVMQGALRLLNIPPDNLPTIGGQVIMARHVAPTYLGME